MQIKFISQEEKLLKKAIELAKLYPMWSDELDQAIDDWANVAEKNQKKQEKIDEKIDNLLAGIEDIRKGDKITIPELFAKGYKYDQNRGPWIIFKKNETLYCFTVEEETLTLDTIWEDE